jgi:hypothetical protein
MAASIVVDASFLIEHVGRSVRNHAWANACARRFPPPWKTCDAALSEAFHLPRARGAPVLVALLRRGAVSSDVHLAEAPEEVLKLPERYVDVPMSFADARLVRMTEIVSDPILLTTDADFRIYRRLGRRAIPCALPD